MSEPLTAAELCEVATTVTGIRNHNYWVPKFDGPSLQRAQVLAVVEWLSQFIENLEIVTMDNERDLLCRAAEVTRHIANKNITALQRLVLELKKK